MPMIRATIVAVLIASAAAAADAPTGYGKAPDGFRWEKYPTGQWGLVQNGLGVPKSVPPAAAPGVAPPAPTPGTDALAEVNAKRAARGLRPYVNDPLLARAAQAAASFRAQHRMFGHVTGGMGDFAFLPPGAHAASAGCAAYPPSYGFMACTVYESYTYAGAAKVRGPDGKDYCHIFVR